VKEHCQKSGEMFREKITYVAYIILYILYYDYAVSLALLSGQLHIYAGV